MSALHKLNLSLALSLLILPLGGTARGQNVSTNASPTPADAVSNTDRVQKLTEAGLEFDVPKGWRLETKSSAAGDAYRIISPDGNASIAFIPSFENDVDDRLDAIRDAAQLDAKSFKAGEEKTETLNGIPCTARTDNVDNGDTILVTGMIRGYKPVVFVRSGDKAAMQANAAALDRIYHSVKVSR